MARSVLIPTSQLTLGIDLGGTSVKGALLAGRREVWTGRSEEYVRPERGELAAAIGALLGASPLGESGSGGVGSVGVCAPGLRDSGGVITRAVNVPGLVGVSPLGIVAEALAGLPGMFAGSIADFTDAHAAAADYWQTCLGRVPPGHGRLLAISIGTGVGACVLDAGAEGEPVPLIVSGRGPGQLGQMDVGVEEYEPGAWAGKPMPRPVPIGPDGGRGTLEAYMGLPALRARFGGDLVSVIASGGMRADRAPISALVRALRIAHAIYTPQRVVLLGGVGIRLGPLLVAMRERAGDGLTPLAKQDWMLEAGESDFHAARGAAWLGGRI